MEMRNRPSDEPKTYVPRKSHPDYKEQESAYVVAHVLPREALSNQPLPEKWLGDQEAIYRWFHPERSLDKIMQAWSRNSKGKTRFSKRGDKHVIDAVKTFGIDALRNSDYPSETKLRENELTGQTKCMIQLNSLVCRVLRYWTGLAREGNLEERRRAIRCLKAFGKALIPESRGKRDLIIKPTNVKIYYWRLLFCLYQIRNALRTDDRNQSRKVETASKNFKVPVEQIRELWKLDDNDQPTVRLIPIKEMARTLTAWHFGITQHRVSNILAL